MFIPKEELKLVKSINADSVGTLYWYNGELIRMIYPEKTVETKKLFEEGIVKELVEKNLLVDTEITNYHIVEGDMVLRHKVIEPITYEYQWTIDMKKDAALLILNILKILKPKGYDLWDCHTGNILFYNGKPIYVDFGSIQKFDKLDLIYAWDSFKCLYLYQQRLYNKGFYEIINAFAKAANTYAAKDEIYRVLYPMIPLKLLKLKNKIEYNYYTVSMLYHRYTLGELQENDTTKIKQILLKLYPYIKFLIPIKENQKYKHSKKELTGR